MDDTGDKGVLSGDVVAEVDVLGGSEDPVQWVCLSVNFWTEFLIDRFDLKKNPTKMWMTSAVPQFALHSKDQE